MLASNSTYDISQSFNLTNLLQKAGTINTETKETDEDNKS